MFYINLFSNEAMQQLEQMPKGEQKRRVYKELWTVFFFGVMGERADELHEILDFNSEGEEDV